MAADGLASVIVSVTTLDDELKRTMEPRAASPAVRLKTIRRLNDAGIPVGVLVAPIIPAVNDSEIESVVEAGACGARDRWPTSSPGVSPRHVGDTGWNGDDVCRWTRLVSDGLPKRSTSCSCSSRNRTCARRPFRRCRRYNGAMCLLVFNWQPAGRYPLVFVGNRDEFHERPAEPLAWWHSPNGLLAGRDVTGGGTWLGVTRGGRFAVVTNYREMGERRQGAPSRGRLITRFADPSVTVGDYAGELSASAGDYAGYNLLFGEPGRGTLNVFSNRDGPAKPVPAGVHGLSNHLLDTPWPKLVRTRQRFSAELASDDPDIEKLFDILADRTPAVKDELPDTGIGHHWESLLSSPFIVSDEYGTRCSTVVIVRADGVTHVAERSFDTAGRMTGELVERIDPNN